MEKKLSKTVGGKIYWDRSLCDLITPISIDDLLNLNLTQNSAVQIALLNNKHLQSIYENLGIAQANLAQSGLLKNPIFSFNYKFSTVSNVTDLIDINFLQNFLEILLIPLKKKMAKVELEATQAFIATRILATVAETKIAFTHLVITYQIWEKQKEALLAYELAYEAAEQLQDIGNRRAIDTAYNKIEYEECKVRVASLEIALLDAKEKLNKLMGLWGKKIIWEYEKILPQLPTTYKNYTNIERYAIENSYDLRMSWKKLLSIAASYGIDTTKLIFPKMDIGLSAEREESIWYVGPAFSLALPFFDFGKANSLKAQSAIYKQWNSYSALAVDIRSNARSYRFSFLNAFREAKYFEKKVVPLAQKITNYTLEQYNAMQMSVFSLLEAKRKEIEKTMAYLLKLEKFLIWKVKMQTLISGHVFRENSTLVESFYE